MLHKGYDVKGSVAKKINRNMFLVVSLKELGSKSN
jgi:hypothetical protein